MSDGIPIDRSKLTAWPDISLGLKLLISLIHSPHAVLCYGQVQITEVNPEQMK